MSELARNSKLRAFLCVAAALAVAACVGSRALRIASAAPADTVTVKIIAFNDFHGNLQSPGNFRADAQSPSVAVGGADALAGYVRMLKEENPNHVVVAAGDLVGASPLVSALFHDEGTVEVMNRLGLELTSVGNHEFDKGAAELLRKQNGGCSKADANTCEGAQVNTTVPFSGAKFQYLAANVVHRESGKPILPAYAIKTFGGIPVAFIGLTLEATPTMVVPSGVAGLRFEEEASTINDVVRDLKKQGIHSFVVLIHQGGAQTPAPIVDISGCAGDLDSSPIKSIVSRLDDEVGLVVSGHTHQAYICELPDASGKKILVTSALSYGRVITDIDVSLDPATKQIVGATAKNMLVDRTNPKITPDPAIRDIVNAYAILASPIANRPVGSITADITQKLNSAGESALGDLLADTQLEATRESAGAQIAFMNRGGIRAALSFAPATGSVAGKPGSVSYGALFTVQPFGNSLVTMTLTGQQMKNLLEQQFKGCSIDFPTHKMAERADHQILQVSEGFRYTWDPAGADCARVDVASIQLSGKTIRLDEKYRVTVNSFLADGGDQMYEFTRGTDRVTGELDVDAAVAYFGKHSPVSPSPMGRINLASAAKP